MRRCTAASSFKGGGDALHAALPAPRPGARTSRASSVLDQGAGQQEAVWRTPDLLQQLAGGAGFRGRPGRPAAGWCVIPRW
jgi:hypothetical protein